MIRELLVCWISVCVLGVDCQECIQVSSANISNSVITLAFEEPNSEQCVENIPLNVTVFIEIFSRSNFDTDVETTVEVSYVNLDESVGDLLVIGKGRQEDVFRTAPSLMFVQSQVEEIDLLIFHKDVTAVYTAHDSAYSDRKFKLKWKRSGTEVAHPPTTPSTTTPTSEAERQAIILCFRKILLTCDQFESDYETPLKSEIAYMANEFVEKHKLTLPTNIIVGDVKVTCRSIKPTNPHTKAVSERNNNFLMVSITRRHNDELPAFKHDQLQELFKDFDTKKEYQIAECRSYPNFWYWYFGTAVMLILIMIIILAFWKCTNWEYWNEKANMSKPPVEGEVNEAFESPEDVIKEDMHSVHGNGFVFELDSAPPKTDIPNYPLSNWLVLSDRRPNHDQQETPKMFPETNVMPPSPGPSGKKPMETEIRNRALRPPKDRDLDTLSEHIYEDVQDYSRHPASPSISLDRELMASTTVSLNMDSSDSDGETQL